MEIANLQFWYDYIQNHKRIKEKIGKHKQAPIKVWKKIPEIVLNTLDEFRKAFKNFNILSNQKLLREIHHTWRTLRKEINKRNIQIHREQQVIHKDSTNIEVNKKMCRKTINSLQLMKPAKINNCKLAKLARGS